MNTTLTKLIGALALYLFFNYGAYGQISGDTYAKAKAAGYGTITLSYVETPSFASANQQGQIEGLCVDLMEAFTAYVKEKEGITLNTGWKTIGDPNDFKVCMANMKAAQGGVFGLGNITITEQRKKEYHFSPPFISNITVIITHREVPTLTSINKIGNAFKGLKAYTVRGTTNELRILEIKQKHIPDLEVVYTEASTDMLELVSKDRQSFSNLDFTYYLAILKNQLPIKRHPVGDKSAEQFGIIMPKSNDWEPLMNSFMASFTETTEYRKIISRHLGSNALRLLDTIVQSGNN